MPSSFAVVDLFAGPGGLAEGFSRVVDADGRRPFRLALSVEKEASAHSTLLLRSFLRQFPTRLPAAYYDFLNNDRSEPDWKNLHPGEWARAKDEALHLELGLPDADAILDRRIDCIRDSNSGNVILIGGPPCQAYSLVGRARNRGTKGSVPRDEWGGPPDAVRRRRSASLTARSWPARRAHLYCAVASFFFRSVSAARSLSLAALV